MAREDTSGAPVPAPILAGLGPGEFQHLGKQAPAEHHRQAPGPRPFHGRSGWNGRGGGLPGLGRGGDKPPDEGGGKEGLVQRGDHRPEDVPLGGQDPDPDLEGRKHAPLVGRVGDGAHCESPEFGSYFAMGMAEHDDHRVEACGEQGLRHGADQRPAGTVRVGKEGLGAAHPLRLAGGEEDAGGAWGRRIVWGNGERILGAGGGGRRVYSGRAVVARCGEGGIALFVPCSGCDACPHGEKGWDRRGVTLGLKPVRRQVLLLPLFAFLASCGGEGVSPTTPPPAPPRPPRQLTGIEPFSPRTDIRVGERVGPLVVYGNFDDGTTGSVDAEWTSSDPDVVAIGEDDFAEGIGTGTAVVTAAFEGFEAELDFLVEDPSPRSETDRPDDIGGPQVHFVYAVPSDWEDRNRDRFGEIERSVAAIQAWLPEEIGQRLRLDTYEGRPDVSFLRLPFTHQEGDGTAGGTVSDILRQAYRLEVTGDKILAIFYEGSVAGVCGSAPLFGRGGAVYVGRCSDAELGVDEETISTYEAVMVHELFHVFGAVASCAPNYIEGSHVGDEPTDLMYVGSERPVRGEETVIDVGRNDYYGHGRAECLDTSGSRFLEPATGLAAGSRSVGVRIAAGDWPLRCGVEH